jgi:hypothetical protein
VNVAAQIISRLSFDEPFSPSFFHNPSLQMFYANIEALALQRSEMPVIEDQLEPDLSHFAQQKSLFAELDRLVPDETVLPVEHETKKKGRTTKVYLYLLYTSGPQYQIN